MIPLVREVISASPSPGPGCGSRGSISQKTGVISCQRRACAVATKVNDGTMTSPVRPAARIMISRPMVPLVMATQCFTPQNAATRASNSRTRGPSLVSQRSSRIPSTMPRMRSLSPMFGRPTWRGASNAGGAEEREPLVGFDGGFGARGGARALGAHGACGRRRWSDGDRCPQGRRSWRVARKDGGPV